MKMKSLFRKKSGLIAFSIAVLVINYPVAQELSSDGTTDPDRKPKRGESKSADYDESKPLFESIEQWRQIDERIVRFAREGKRVDDEQARLHADLDRDRDRYEPGRLGPGSVLARRRIAERLAESEALRREMSPIREEMYQQSRRIQMGRESGLAQLQGWLPEATDAAEKGRIEAWIEGLEAIPAHGYHAFIGAITGLEPPRRGNHPPHHEQGHAGSGAINFDATKQIREKREKTKGATLEEMKSHIEILTRRQGMLSKNLEEISLEIEVLSARLTEIEGESQ